MPALFRWTMGVQPTKPTKGANMSEKEFKVFTPRLPDFGPGEVTKELVAWAKETNSLLAQLVQQQADQQAAMNRLAEELKALRSRP